MKIPLKLLHTFSMYIYKSLNDHRSNIEKAQNLCQCLFRLFNKIHIEINNTSCYCCCCKANWFNTIQSVEYLF